MPKHILLLEPLCSTYSVLSTRKRYNQSVMSTQRMKLRPISIDNIRYLSLHFSEAVYLAVKHVGKCFLGLRIGYHNPYTYINKACHHNTKVDLMHQLFKISLSDDHTLTKYVGIKALHKIVKLITGQFLFFCFLQRWRREHYKKANRIFKLRMEYKGKWWKINHDN